MLRDRNFNGARLKSARTYRGKTISQIADETGVSKQAISQFETKSKILVQCFELQKSLS